MVAERGLENMGDIYLLVMMRKMKNIKPSAK